MDKSKNLSTYVFFSAMIAIVLQLVPVNNYFAYLKPNFLLLINLGWIIFVPHKFGVMFGALNGLIFDFISGVPIGINMISFTLLSAMVIYLSGWLSYFSLNQRTVFIFSVVVLFELLVSTFYLSIEIPIDIAHIFLISITSLVVWHIIVIWIGTGLVLKGELTLGGLIAFRILSSYVTNPILRLTSTWQNFQDIALSVERLGDVIDNNIIKSAKNSSYIFS